MRASTSRGTRPYESLLSDPDVDAAYVPLPNALHHEWTMRALAAGSSVLCEKPYHAPRGGGGGTGVAERNGLVLMEAFMYRHHPQTLRVAELVGSGAIGRLRLVRASFSFLLDDESDIRAQPGLDGGALLDIGCYCINGARLIAGEPERVAAERVVGLTGVDVLRRDDALPGRRPRADRLLVSIATRATPRGGGRGGVARRSAVARRLGW